MKKKSKFKRNLIITFSILLLITVSILIINLQLTGFKLENINMIQYAGGFNDRLGSDSFYFEANPRPVTASEAIIGDYKIITEKKEFGQLLGEWKCKPLPETFSFSTTWGRNNQYSASWDNLIDINKNFEGNIFGGAVEGCCFDFCGYGYLLNDRNKRFNRPFNYQEGSKSERKSKNWLEVQEFGEDERGCPTMKLTFPALQDCKKDNQGEGNCEECNNYQQSKQVILGGSFREILYQNTDFAECWARFDIYKNNELINSTEWQPNGAIQFFFDDLVINLGFNRVRNTREQECLRIENTFNFLIPNDAFSFEITASERQVFEDSQTTAEIKITNNWKSVEGDLTVDYEIPTAIGSAKKTQTKKIQIPFGESTHIYDIPTTQVTDTILITPTLRVNMESSEFKGVNGYCAENPKREGFVRDLSTCQSINIGTLEGETFEVNIIPKPLFLESPCVEGYSENVGDSSICVRDDIKELTCFQIGCPFFENRNFFCTSAGICAEQIFVEKKCESDEMCPTDTKCDITSGLCVREEIFENIFQCQTASDCATPCTGITKSCVNNVCEYSGECSETKLDCLDVGCPENHDCIENNGNNVCVKEPKSFLKYYIIGIILLFSLFLVIFFIKKR